MQHLINVFEYLLFIKDSQNLNLENEKLHALLIELSNLMLLSGSPLMSYYMLENLGRSNNYHIQKFKHNIWINHSTILSEYFTVPSNPTQSIWFPRQSILRKVITPVNTVSSNTRRNQNNKQKPQPFRRGNNMPSKPVKKPFGNPAFGQKTNLHKQAGFNIPNTFSQPPGPPVKRKPKPPTNFGNRTNMPVPMNKPFPSSNTRMAPPTPAPPTRPTNVLKKNKPRPPPRVNPIPKPPVNVPKPAPSHTITRPNPGSSTLKKKTVPTKPNVVKPPPPRRNVALPKPPGPPVQRNFNILYQYIILIIIIFF